MQIPASRRMVGKQLRLSGTKRSATTLIVVAFASVAPFAWGQSASTPPQPSAQSDVAGQSTSEAQSTPPRVIAFAQLQSSYSTLGIVGALDIDAGFTFNDHIAADIGVPLLLTRSPFSPVLNRDYYWSGALGEPYLDVRYTRSIHHADLTSILTATMPFGNQDETFITGRVGADWYRQSEIFRRFN